MLIIQNNPYRTLGILVGTSARDQERQTRRLRQYLEAEQEPEDDYSFPVLGQLHRTIESINEATSKLNLDNDRINAALFWFWNGNPITDEPAIDSLKDGNIDEAINIWRKLIYNSENEMNDVSKRNASAFFNLSSLYLSEYGIDEETIQLKLQFLESDFVKEFKSVVTDETYKIEKGELQLTFLNILISQKDINPTELINSISDIDFQSKKDFLKGFAQIPIEQIEKKIEESKSMRKANKANSIKAANSLIADTKDLIKQLKSILGTSNIKYASIADKLAMEFFACGRDYFMHFKEKDTDPSDNSMKLFKISKSYAIGNIAKQTIEENINNLQEWIDDKPERDKQKLIEEDFIFITSKLERFQNLNDTIGNAKDLVETCKPKLINIRKSLGKTDDFYLKISGAVVNNIQGMLVTVVNDEQELFQFAMNPSSANIHKIAEIAVRRNGANRENLTAAITNLITDRYTAAENLKNAIRGALAVSRTLGELDMDNQLRARYNTNNSTLLSLANQLGVNTSTSSSSKSTYPPTTSSNSSSSSNSSVSSWAEENPGCLLILIVFAIILLISIFSK